MTFWTSFLKSLPVVAVIGFVLILHSIETHSGGFSGRSLRSVDASEAGRPAVPSLRQSIDTIEASVPFRVAATYTQGDTPATSLRLYQNDALTHTVPVSDSVEFPYPNGLPAGTYALKVSAVAADGAESCGDGTCANPFVLLTVTQTPVCAYSLSASNSEVAASATTVQVNLTTQTGCAWTASSSVSWLSVAPASGNTAGTLAVTVQANTSPGSRAGVVTVQGQTFTVTQAGVSTPLAVGYTLRGCTGIITAAAAPDTRTGWGIQFRTHNADGTFTPIGSRDTTVPYQRNPGTLAPGSHTFSGVWTRTSTPSVEAQPVTFVCN